MLRQTNMPSTTDDTPGYLISKHNRQTNKGENQTRNTSAAELRRHAQSAALEHSPQKSTSTHRQQAQNAHEEHGEER
jgi:hypothetical protein